MTIKDLAQLAGVSHATVSRALADDPRISPATRIRIRRLAEELGYRPNLAARRLSRRRSRAVGVAWPGLGARWVGYLAEQIHAAFLARGFEVLFSMAPPAEAAALFGQQMLDGVVIGGGADEAARLALLRWKEESRLALVTAGFKLDEAISSVDADRAAAIALAVRHLAAHGHRRIALLSDQAEKIIGYREGMAAGGLSFPPEYLQTVPYDYLSVAGAVDRLLGLPAPPTALIVGSAQAAFHTIYVLRTRGIPVPQAVAVIGYDEVPGCADQEIPLTTVGPAAAEMAAAVADILLAAMEEEKSAPVHLRIQPRLVVRRSCGTAVDAGSG